MLYVEGVITVSRGFLMAWRHSSEIIRFTPSLSAVTPPSPCRHGVTKGPPLEFRKEDHMTAPSNPWLEAERRRARAEAIERKRANESPARKAAWQAVNDALRSGKLVRQLCELNHDGCDVKPTQFHHTMGYARRHRLTGVWACMNCHAVETARAQARRMPMGGAGVVILDD